MQLWCVVFGSFWCVMRRCRWFGRHHFAYLQDALYLCCVMSHLHCGFNWGFFSRIAAPRLFSPGGEFPFLFFLLQTHKNPRVYRGEAGQGGCRLLASLSWTRTTALLVSRTETGFKRRRLLLASWSAAMRTISAACDWSRPHVGWM